VSIYTLIFWKRLFQNAVYAFASGSVGIALSAKTGLLSSVPWETALEAGGYSALIAALLSFTSNAIPNTPPGDFLPPK